MVQTMWNDMTQYTFNFHKNWKLCKLFLEYICVFKYTNTLHLFSQIYSNLPLYKMKWNSYFLIFCIGYILIECAKKMWNSFKKFRCESLQHAYPWKVVQCDTPKGVTIMCFHHFTRPKIIYMGFTLTLT